MKNIVILGSTGSVGGSALDVVSMYQDKLNVVGLACRNSQKKLIQQIKTYQPQAVVLFDGEPQAELKEVCRKFNCELTQGRTALIELAAMDSADVILAAMTGVDGLEPVLAAIQKGKQIALANKEVLVMAGELVMRASRSKGVDILPVDSEHNAIFQCLQGEDITSLERILLCASGGPFFGADQQRLSTVTVEEALDHPRWKMGRKITIDSATLMNKGLEMIEARWLFNCAPHQIRVVVHPQSIAHSMVEFVDGNIIAQLGCTDMVMPIQYCLSFPHRWPNQQQKLHLPEVKKLEFFEPDKDVFRCLMLAEQALAEGGTAPAILNAADEVAVAAFLKGRIRFIEISRVIAETMERVESEDAMDIRAVREADAIARRSTLQIIGELDV